MKRIAFIILLINITLFFTQCTTSQKVPQLKQTSSERYKYLEQFSKKDTISYNNSTIKTYADFSIKITNDSAKEMCSQVFYKKSKSNKEPLQFRLVNSSGELVEIKAGEEQLFNASEIMYTLVDVPPKFPGGEEALLRFIATNVHYPFDDRENGIQGKVYIRFIINKAGVVSNVKVVRSVSPNLDREAMRVIQSLPNWTPGYIENEPVNVFFTIPINFRLN